MYKAMVIKELRDTLPVICIALIAYVICLVNQIGYPVLPIKTGSYGKGIPFLDPSTYGLITIVSVCFAIALGLWQTIAESARGTWLLLLHRPASFNKLIGIKLAIGSGLYLLVSGGIILNYVCWAAAPGTHASPFAWWMTEPVWIKWMIILLCYLGAFLSGIRPGRWFGTRLLPLVASGCIASTIMLIHIRLWFWCVGAVALTSIFMLSLIFYIIRTHDIT